MKKVMVVVFCLILVCQTTVFASGQVIVNQKASQPLTKANTQISWNDAVAQAMSLFADGGGYYTGSGHPTGFTQNTWEGMDGAFQIGPNDTKPTIDVSKARPSFCSSGIYMLLLKSISIWDNDRNTISKDAWVNLKPYTLNITDESGNVIPRENDGYGCWGRANANGPGLGVLVNELGAGENYYIGNKTEYSSADDYYAAWDGAKPGDFLKIFWNSGIGCEDNNPVGDEAGHMVMFLGKYKHYAADGTRDDIITWWSSNGSRTDINAGYGVQSCAISKIYRAVLTRVTNPNNFNKAASIDRFNVNTWLDSLNGKHHGTVDELKNNSGIKANQAPTDTNQTSADQKWNDTVAQAMSLFADGGGYYTGSGHPTGFTQNTWEGMDRAFQIGPNDVKPTIDVSQARPSFCSSGIYMLLLKSLSIWDNGSTISRNAWVNLKPYTLNITDESGNVIPREDDGYGCWGRANANGPGLGVLVNELDAGENYYIGNKTEYSSADDYYAAWDGAKPGDFLKIFWNSGIGCEDNNPVGDEAGHMVMFLGKYKHYAADGTRDDIITWWSSNGSRTDINAGYGVQSCAISKIYRAVLTRVTSPGNFNKAASIDRFNVNKWLSDLNGKHHGTVEELKLNTGITAKAAIDAIAALPAPEKIALTDEAAVKAARALVTAANNDINITNLSKLTACEQKISELKAAESARQAQLAKEKAAIDAITALSAPESITLTDEAAVKAARVLVTAANNDANITNLSKLTTCEAKITELKHDANIKETIDKITKAPDKSNTEISIAENSKVKKSILDAIQGKDKSVTFTNDTISWTFDGKDMKGSTKDLDLSVNIADINQSTTPNKEAIKEKINGADALILSFAENGVLPGKATVKVKLSDAWLSGKDLKNIYVYYYNPQTKAIEAIAEKLTVDANGYITFSIDHNSDYFVVDKNLQPKQNLPKTGNFVDFNVLVAAGLISIIVGLSLLLKRKIRRS
ncbi:LPXTG cell wall anchor domain-containing protein [Clostridium sp. YIM B02515]|uniref:LPXTG cell wall anchor domain-containing protein n=1 Tax=Clostridium rhizosphaerae TaxID=2803861 RepID=A0ABS1TCP0_9CLOT|nr:LPXTG cell wall anchor domain-containing protein [Clostridium rhizosphaerae]MBL4937126.1 LPXTG cell wall anchor domain-containing protein [Clostridium rhizosphaerae]